MHHVTEADTTEHLINMATTRAALPRNYEDALDYKELLWNHPQPLKPLGSPFTPVTRRS